MRLDRVRGPIVTDHGDVQPASRSEVAKQPIEFFSAAAAGAVPCGRAQRLARTLGFSELAKRPALEIGDRAELLAGGPVHEVRQSASINGQANARPQA